MTISRMLGASASVVALAVMTACSDAANTPTGTSSLQHAVVVGPPPGTPSQPTPEAITLCKVGSGADFSVTSATTSPTNGAVTSTSSAHLNDGDCVVVSFKPLNGTFGGSTTEISADPGFYLDHIDVTTITDKLATPVTTTVTGTSTMSVPATQYAGTAGATWTYYNLPIPSGGCTFTIGYWKTHAGFGPQGDVVTPLLPIGIGNGTGKSISVTSATLAVQLLSFNGSNNVFAASNGINKLYAQLLGAKLSIANGVSGSAVASTIAAADAYLSTHDSGDWASATKAEKNQVLGWMTTLDNFNNGLLGPAHCS